MCEFQPRGLLATLLSSLLLLDGCQIQPPAERTRSTPAGELPPLAVESAELYRVVPEQSRARFYVYRGGPLAEYGHSHVIVARNITGTVHLAPEFRDSGFDLTIPVDGLTVDPPAVRREEGGEFASELPDQAAGRTRENMLGPGVLDAGEYPRIELRSRSLAGPAWQPDITFRLRLHGVERELTVPVAVIRQNGGLIAIGEFKVLQSEFGIEPFTALGGGLRVKDEVRVKFRVEASRVRD